MDALPQRARMLLCNHEYPVIKKYSFRKKMARTWVRYATSRVALPFAFIIMKRCLNKRSFAAESPNEQVAVKWQELRSTRAALSCFAGQPKLAACIGNYGFVGCY